MLQYRPKEPAVTRNPMYNPARDFAHVGPWMIHRAIASLDLYSPDFVQKEGEAKPEAWMQQYLVDKNVKWDDIVDAIGKFGAGMGEILKNGNPDVVFEESGFSAVPGAIKALIFNQIGKVFLGAVWVGVRDVHRPDDDPPLAFKDMVDMAAHYGKELENAPDRADAAGPVEQAAAG